MLDCVADHPDDATRSAATPPPRAGTVRPTGRLEIDGRAATTEQLAQAALDNYGHFTAMQVRGQAVRGLRLHLGRLDTANRELFDLPLDGDRVLESVTHALRGTSDASVGVRVIRLGPGPEPSVLVTIGPPTAMPAGPWGLRSVRYVRPVAHIKHLGTFGQSYHRVRAERDGFDEALLTGPDGIVSEGAITNIGFLDGGTVVWPDAPALAGVTWQVLEPALAERGLPSARRPVLLDDLPSFDAAFVTNSWGVAPVGAVDGVPLAQDADFAQILATAYESVPWNPL